MRYVLALFLMATVIITVSCGQSGGSAAETVEKYLEALNDKDDNTISVISCADWETEALMELDALQTVETRLEGVDCEVTGQEDGTSLVNCQGRLIATYEGEDQEIELSSRVYQVVKQDGDFLVCGTR